ncbi:MAG: hypothetical protein MI802_15930 [Desulfobacterales bacterium]|nr:hypothetical protein [Desulfobacterales bacterium]
MSFVRSGLDRRGNINRRQMSIDPPVERRLGERREQRERRQGWVRCSEWSSIDLSLRNQYFWNILS